MNYTKKIKNFQIFNDSTIRSQEVRLLKVMHCTGNKKNRLQCEKCLLYLQLNFYYFILYFLYWFWTHWLWSYKYLLFLTPFHQKDKLVQHTTEKRFQPRSHLNLFHTTPFRLNSLHPEKSSPVNKGFRWRSQGHNNNALGNAQGGCSCGWFDLLHKHLAFII